MDKTSVEQNVAWSRNAAKYTNLVAELAKLRRDVNQRIQLPGVRYSSRFVDLLPENTVFYAALARSIGLPTRMVAGLVYQQGRFYYHAWPEVWLGEWIPTDPTLGQPIADATHLGLIEAESERLVSLGQFIGKLRIQVLDD